MSFFGRLFDWLGRRPAPARPGPAPPPPPPPAPPSPAPPQPAPTGWHPEPWQVDLVGLHNQARASQSARDQVPRPPLRLTERAWRAAAMRNAAEMRTHLLDHGDWLTEDRAVGFPPGASLGQNIALGQTTGAQVFADWMSSDGHRANILNPAYDEVGLASDVDPEAGRFWAANFAGPG